MDDRQVALDACNSAQKERFTKLALAYIDAFQAAEGNPNSETLRGEAGERFKNGLRVLQAAHNSSHALVTQVFGVTET